MTDRVQQHLAGLARDRYSQSTVHARGALLATIADPLNMTRETTQAWWESRQIRTNGDPRAASSLSGEASHAREFWRWSMRQGLIDRNPADWLPKVRQAHTLAVVVPESDLDKVMLTAPPPMRRMLALGAMAGLRSSEIGAVKWSDIDRSNGVIWVRGAKGDRDRTVPLSAGLLAELGDPGEGVIIGAAMTSKAVSMAIGRYLRAHGSDFTAHKLRARYATRFIAATGDVVAAAAVLGHSDLTSIGRYAVASSDTMRKGAEACGRIG